jgi:hypothetical protein
MPVPSGSHVSQPQPRTLFRQIKDLPPLNHSQLAPKLNIRTHARMMRILQGHPVVTRADTDMLQPNKPILVPVTDFSLLAEPLQHLSILWQVKRRS